MTIGHWTAAVLVAALLAGCNPAGRDADRTSGDAGGMAGGATPVDTTMTGGQGGMADTSMGGASDTTRTGTGADTSKP
ncbi:MAG: hypothetical protein ACREOC_17055 [Gemmatimonadales bacterium]